MTFIEFKMIYARFLKTMRYMAQKRLTVKNADDLQWQKLLKTFNKNIVEPTDQAWQSLPENIQAYFFPKNRIIERNNYEGQNISKNGVPF